MLVVVNTVSALVHIYSIGYMHHDPHRPRFFAYLSLFTFAMLMLVTSDNLVQMFFGWEGVGLASYLLIGFWYKKPSANAAAIKAFVVNRVGDFGFPLGIFGVFVLFGSVNLGTIFANAAAICRPKAPNTAQTVLTFLGYALDKQVALTVVCLLLFMGAMGKSAQVPLHTWLPDAMEGPTPVSALIHAATMVTAGVFMLARLSPLFELSHSALTVVTFIGAITAFFAATVGLVQNDIKRVIAYSTCSQLGYMFVALGVGFYSAAIFHLFTHAFFKALLFLGSGSVIHAVSDEQDMRKMGGLRTLIPTTYWMMVIGTLALTGVGIPATIIGTAGFFSKDAIIEGAFVGHNAVASFAFIAAGHRRLLHQLLFLAPDLHDLPRQAARHRRRHAPRARIAAGDAGAAVHPRGRRAVRRRHLPRPVHRRGLCRVLEGRAVHAAPTNHILHDIHDVPLWVKLAPFVAMIIGFGIAYLFYIRSPEMPKNLARAAPRALRVPAQQVVFRRALRLPLRAPGQVARPLPVEEGRRLAHRRLRAGRHLGARRRRDQPRRQAADRLPLPLRLRHADRRRRPRHLDDARELLLMSGLPILSLGHLPAAGRRAPDPADPRRRRRCAPQHPQRRAADDRVHLRAVAADLDRLRQCARPASSSSRRRAWLDSGISYHMGVDGISMLFVILTTFLMPLCILASWESIEKRVKEYMIAFLVLETLMIGVFCALDIVLFYVFFEGGLIPMFLIIGVWGGKRRVYASFKFFLYTLLGSVLMLLAIMAMFWQAGTTDIPTLLTHDFPATMQTWLWLAFFASFAVKMPMWPVHTWLPDAHVEAPTAGSVILAGILLKMGGYGFLRFSLPMFPLASRDLRAVRLHAVGRRHHLHLAGGADAGGHEEADRLFVGRPYGLRDHGHLRDERGRACRARSSRCCRHGLVSGALFLCVGVIYDRMHTREIAAYGGLVNHMPKYAVAFMIFTMANVGLPGTSGFVGEFLTLLGVFKVNTWVAFFATTGVILSAAYALWLYRRVVFGALTKESLKGMLDLSGAREGDALSADRAGHLLRRLSGAGLRRRRRRRCKALINNVTASHRRRADRGGELTGVLRTMTPELLSSLSLCHAGTDPRRRRAGAADDRRLFRRAGQYDS